MGCCLDLRDLSRGCGRGWVGMYLETEDLGLDEGERAAVDLDEAFAFLLSQSLSVSFLVVVSISVLAFGLFADLAVGDCRGSLLLAEALYTLGGRHLDGWRSQS